MTSTGVPANRPSKRAPDSGSSSTTQRCTAEFQCDTPRGPRLYANLGKGRLNAVLAANFNRTRADEGLNHVYGQVATRLVVRLLESMAEQPGMLPLRLFGLETALAATIFVDVPGQTERLAVRLAGFADRVDQLPDGRLRVVDYKSGLVKRADLQLRGYRDKLSPAEAVERLLTEPSSSVDKVRQLWLYRLMLAHTAKRETAETAILSLRNIDEGLLSADLNFLTDSGEDFVAVSEELVRKIVLRMLDPTEPIRKTDDFTKCEYCAYRGICAR